MGHWIVGLAGNSGNIDNAAYIQALQDPGDGKWYARAFDEEDNQRVHWGPFDTEQECQDSITAVTQAFNPMA